jgi:hypothetical protein
MSSRPRPTLTLPQGSTDTSTISTALTGGVSESVSLSASGMPSGASASFGPAAVTAGAFSSWRRSRRLTVPVYRRVNLCAGAPAFDSVALGSGTDSLLPVADRDQLVQQLVQRTREIADADLEDATKDHFELAKKQLLNSAGDDEERTFIRAISWLEAENLV